MVRIRVNEPCAAFGYDWERYGKSGNGAQDELDRTHARDGLRVITSKHKEYGLPFTVFVLGKMLDNALLTTTLQDVIDLAGDLIDVEQHSYAHGLYKDHAERGKALSLIAMEEDLRRASDGIEDKTGQRPIGLRTPMTFFRGFRGEKDRLKVIRETGIRFISSDGRGWYESRPAPILDEIGEPRIPYWYTEDGFEDLLEIPVHGYSDNYLKGYARQPIPKAFEPAEELKVHLMFFQECLDRKMVFCPPCHPWCVGRGDPEGVVLTGLLEFAQKNGVRTLSYRMLYDEIRSGRLLADGR